MLTVLRSEAGIVGIYKGTDLVCTHDKHSTKKDVERSIERAAGKDEVHERTVVANKTGDLPASIELPEKPKKAK